MSKDRKNQRPTIVPDHESIVRRHCSESRGQSYVAFRSLGEAKECPDGVMILQGDWGGQIYVVCPVRMVTCSQAALDDLLQELDKIAWNCNDGEGASVYFERAALGYGIAGGMGGGYAIDGIWIHQEFVDKNMGDRIRGVILGQ